MGFAGKLTDKTVRLRLIWQQPCKSEIGHSRLTGGLVLQTKSIDALVEKNIMTIYVEITAKALEGGGTPSIQKPQEPEESKETEEQLPEEQAAQTTPETAPKTAPQTAKPIWPAQSLKSSQED